MGINHSLGASSAGLGSKNFTINQGNAKCNNQSLNQWWAQIKWSPWSPQEVCRVWDAAPSSCFCSKRGTENNFSLEKFDKILNSGRVSAYLFNEDPDPAFLFNANPDTAPLQSEGNLRPLIYRPSRAPIWTSGPSLWASKALRGFNLSLQSFWILTLIQIRIQHFALMRIQIQIPNIMRIYTNPDPQPYSDN